MKKTGLLLLILTLGLVVQAQNKNMTVFDNSEFVVEPLNLINTIGSDISPALVAGELYFSAVPEKYFNKKNLENKNKAFYSTYFTPLDKNGMPVSARQPVSGFGDKFHEGPVSYCAATGELFVTLSNTIDPETFHKMFPTENIRLRLVIMKQTGGQWKITEELPFNNEKFHFAHPAISQTGDTLIFSSDMDNGSFGKSDLYLSIRNKGKWSDPQNLGKVINTGGNEMFPAFLPGGLLAFASDGHPGNYGGLDIWYTTFPNPVEVFNSGDKINSSFDDFGFIVAPDKTMGYFSSNRPGKGSDDIYCVQFKNQEEIISGKVVNSQTGVPVADATVQLSDCKKQVISSFNTDNSGGFQVKANKKNCPVLEATKDGYDQDRKAISDLNYVELRIKQKYPVLSVKIIDKETGKILENARFEILNGDFDHSSLKKQNGTIQLNINPADQFTFYTSSEGFIPKEIKFSGDGKVQPEFSLTIPLERMAPGKQFVLENLYYDLDKFDIRQDAALVLDRLVKILNENPEIRIELGSHTDCRASAAYNQKLSQNRSESVIRYLVSKGISARRLVAKGYGESQLVNKCSDGVPCTEEEHQANRRTVVRILELGTKK
jgi:outer membrane protein OmpA-like peptidoglycan-associated protein